MSVKVILRADIRNVGKRGDICEVTDGYARNFLFPKGLALVASDGAVSQAAAMRRARDLRDAADRESAQTVASALVPTTIVIKAKTGAEGRLYGSVTTADLAGAIEAQTGIVIDKRKLSFDAVKTTGTYSATVRLHSDVQFPVSFNVVSA
jgi:large subunit ribosomal protein L9